MYLVFDQTVKLLLLGKCFVVVNGQILLNNLAIYSHFLQINEYCESLIFSLSLSYFNLPTYFAIKTVQNLLGPNSFCFLSAFIIIICRLIILLINTLTIGERITARLVSNLTWLDLTKDENMFIFVRSGEVERNLVRLETSCTVFLSPMVSVLCSSHKNKCKAR